MSEMEFAPPKYARIVQAIQRRISDGTYAPGAMLPSESQLVREFGAGRSTVVRALQMLKMQGWIDREHGRGSYVKGDPTKPSDRARTAEAAYDAAESALGTVIAFAGRADVPARVAGALGIPDGAPAVLRRRVSADGEGASGRLVSVWAPLDVAAGTDLGQAAPLSVSVRAHLFALKQLRPVRVTERLCARAATSEEADALSLAPGSPVLGIVATVYDAAGQPIVALDITLPGDLNELEDSYTIT
ncbi:GntR family transcriptional regulator [Allonocardiopsis opalescens]|uniref:DNA-binding GntR family transcriptional regulator n=1 Tax=Allonocardiopsis opalescens TaxID=1144618 RepID=A0A2T0PTK7_9ACTN|nr:GntR family transcriptional regulator [Allonocardiopsis opalescens]PRX92128.1 DNA-binding GntR family transcriptional regulator [Allonocardiopsis opalescens]